MKIQLFNPVRHYKESEKKYLVAIKRVLSSGRLVLGKETEEFENEFAKYCGTKYAVMVNSGTSALLAALLAFDIKAGDEVITTPNTFTATAQAISFSGAKPVFVDIDPKTYNIDPEKIETAINSKTRAIIPVHLYGQPAEMDKIKRIAKKYNLIIIEDAAQAHGAKYKNKLAGNLADAGCFSFYVNKNLPSFGTSGTVTTNIQKIAQKIKFLRDNGKINKNDHTLSLNFMPEEIQACILRLKLKHLDQWNVKRIKIANQYKQALKNLPITLPLEKPDQITHVFHQFVIRTKERNKLQEYLEVKGIQSRPYYPTPLHLQLAFRYLGYKKGNFPETEKAAKEILSIPIYPDLSQKEIKHITEQIKRFFKT